MAMDVSETARQLLASFGNPEVQYVTFERGTNEWLMRRFTRVPENAANPVAPPPVESWHLIIAAIGPILRDAFPHEHRITRLQVAQAIATKLERLGRRGDHQLSQGE